MILNKETVLILDYGSQYTQLIARRVREQNVYSEILPHSASTEEIVRSNPIAIILSGGPDSVYEYGAPSLNRIILELGVPVLGICYGFGLLIKHDDGIVKSTSQSEYGFTKINIEKDSILVKSVEKDTQVWMSHGDSIEKLPKNWSIIARSNNGILAAAEREDSKIYGTQFHPEVIHTVNGKKIL